MVKGGFRRTGEAEGKLKVLLKEMEEWEIGNVTLMVFCQLVIIMAVEDSVK